MLKRYQRKTKDFNINNMLFITIQKPHFNKKTNFFSAPLEPSLKSFDRTDFPFTSPVRVEEAYTLRQNP